MPATRVGQERRGGGKPENKQSLNEDTKFVWLNSSKIVVFALHQTVQNSPDQLWPEEIEEKEPETRRLQQLWPLSLQCTYCIRFTALQALKVLMFCARILPIYWLNQYWMRVKEVSHQSCTHYGLIIRTQMSPSGGIEYKKSWCLQHLFHMDPTPVDIFHIIYSIICLELYLIWLSFHPPESINTVASSLQACYKIGNNKLFR